VNGTTKVGGLFGDMIAGGTVEYSYATGDVSGDKKVGGLVGRVDGEKVYTNVVIDAGAVEYAYSTGSVSGNSDVGGLVGDNGGNVTESYWDTELSEQSSSDGGTGLTTSDMQGDSYNTGFESDIVDDSAFTGVTGDYPDLMWESE
jgi:hypothetical protein